MNEKIKNKYDSQLRTECVGSLSKAAALVSDKPVRGVMTMVFLENGDVAEFSIGRALSLYDKIGALEVLKAKYLTPLRKEKISSADPDEHKPGRLCE